MPMYSKLPVTDVQPRLGRFGLQRLCMGWWLAGLLLLGGWVHGSWAHGQEFGSGALLLKETERVITGKITQRGEFYEVELAPDSRISIPKQNVAHLASSVEELYQAKKRQAVSRWSVGDHYQLTRWCLINNLLSHAAEHYAETVQRSPDHPRVRQLGVELQERMLQDDQFRQYLGLAPLNPPPLAAGISPQPSAEAAHQTATGSAVTPASTFQSKVTQHPEISHYFAERVQPILINRCSQAACHGAQSQSALRILPPYATAAARITSENLASVLQQVASQPHQTSPLLNYATQAHGIQPAAAIALTETKLVQELENWIAFVRNPVVSAVVSNPTSLGSQVRTAEQFQLQPYANAVALIPVNPDATPLRQVPQAAGRQAPSAPNSTPAADLPFPSSSFPVGTAPPTAADIDALDAQLRAVLGEQPAATATAPVDPFDPAEFNRRIK